MKKGIIVQGDPTSGGGSVIIGSGYAIDGEFIALVGDPASCSIIPHKGGGLIQEGDENFLIDGKPVALHGHKVSCGCTLISSKLIENNFVEVTKQLSAFEKNNCILSNNLKISAEKDRQALKEFIESLELDKFTFLSDSASEKIVKILESILSTSQKYGKFGPNYGAQLNESFQNSSRCESVNKENVPPQTKKDTQKTTQYIPQKKVVFTNSGKKGDWNKSLNNPDPNTIYVVDNRHKLETDHLARTSFAQTNSKFDKEKESQDRNGYQQRKVGGFGNRDLSGKKLDAGGHLIPNEYGGPGEKINIVPMELKSNSNGVWRQAEKERNAHLEARSKMNVTYEPIYKGNSKRPYEIEVTTKVVDKNGEYSFDRNIYPN